MLSVEQVLSTFLYLAVMYPITAYLFHSSSLKRSRALYILAAIATAGFGVKLAYDNASSVNYYEVLGVPRHAAPMTVLKRYKDAMKDLSSLRLRSNHGHSEEGEGDGDRLELQMELCKRAYNTLIDEQAREVYNRFGSSSSSFSSLFSRSTEGGPDPRNDELALLLSILAVYAFWGACSLVMTAHGAASAARAPVALVLAGMLVIDGIARLSSLEIPDLTVDVPSPGFDLLSPQHLTEGECVSFMYSLFPLVLVLLRGQAESAFIDTDAAVVAVLVGAVQQAGAAEVALGALKEQLELHATRQQQGQGQGQKEGDEEEMSPQLVHARVAALISDMEVSGEAIEQVVARLVAGGTSGSGSGSSLSSYTWLIFVMLYGAFFLFQ
jgi:curved DNA-binding protein CbpA